MSASSSGGNAPTSHACAACKHQRRKCASDCAMAPYFPPSRAQEFRDVHRLFGLSNLTKVHNSLPPGEKRDTAMRTMILEAGMWRADPVHGACGVIHRLVAQIEATQKELDAVLLQLARYRWKGQPEVPHGQQYRSLSSPLPHLSRPLYPCNDLKPLLNSMPSVMERGGCHDDRLPLPPSEDHFDSKD